MSSFCKVVMAYRKVGNSIDEFKRSVAQVDADNLTPRQAEFLNDMEFLSNRIHLTHVLYKTDVEDFIRKSFE